MSSSEVLEHTPMSLACIFVIFKNVITTIYYRISYFVYINNYILKLEYNSVSTMNYYYNEEEVLRFCV